MSFEISFLAPEADRYATSRLRHPYAVMDRIERDVQDESQPAVGRGVGALLRTLAAAAGARRVLEVGTNHGYSALWLLAGMAPDGVLDTIEINADIARRARANFQEAGLGKRVRVHEGEALDVLPTLPDGAYDLVFLDAAKAEYPRYLDEAARLLRPGGIVAADNVFWLGQPWNEEAQDEDTEGVRTYVARIFSESLWTSAIVPLEDGVGVSVLARP